MSSSAGRATLRVSPRKKNKALPVVPGRAVATPIARSSASEAPPEEDATANEFGHGAFAGPSSPTRRRRRPSATRRRSSSITAAAALISSYSTSPTERTHANSVGDAYEPSSDDDGPESNAVSSKQPTRRSSLKRSGTGRRRPEGVGDNDDDADGFGDDAAETVQGARKALLRGRASPYHMALVTLLFSLAQGMPLASQFKVYSYMMCQVFQRTHDDKGGGGGGGGANAAALPPAPELPSSPLCENVWVENATSTYAAAMATVGALVSLVLLSRCSRLSEHFGRKPLLLGTHVLLGLATVVFRLSVLLPTYVGAAVLYVAVMVLEASAGAPLRIAYQNYVVDTTTEAQRAGALSFVDGFGQIGAFPSSTLGGWLAVVTQRFFAPFYASMAVYTFATAYVLVFVPESKKNRHHTLIDDFERFGESEESARKANASTSNNDDDDDTDGDTDGGIGTESYFSSVDGSTASGPQRRSRLPRLLRKVNFLEPLSVFLPRRHCGPNDDVPKWTARSLRLFTLAVIVVLEESFQVFLVPVLLLYNTNVFRFDVVQNGYLVSLLQGVRAVYLTVCFPWAVSKLRAWFQRRKRARSAAHGGDDEPNERTALVRTSTQEEASNKRQDRGRLDIVIMFLSYLVSAASFCLLATTRTWADQEKQNGKHNDGKKVAPPWVGVAIAIVGIQLGAGATSLRTALLVNAVSELEDDREERQLRDRLRQSQCAGDGHSGARPSAAAAATPSKADVRIHHERHQSKALAANQILCTAVYAFVPLLTSRIFGAGLQSHRPELVWIFKAAVAGLSALVTLVLFTSHS